MSVVKSGPMDRILLMDFEKRTKQLIKPMLMELVSHTIIKQDSMYGHYVSRTHIAEIKINNILYKIIMVA